MIVIAPDKDTCAAHFSIVRGILAELGLPESIDKIQAPSTCVTWLGININSESMSLSIPSDKLKEVQVCVMKAIRCKTISKKHLQSLIGK